MCVDEHTCCDPSHCTSMSVLFSWQSLHSGQNNSEAHFLPQEETSSANRGQRKLGGKSGLYYVFLLMTHFASIQMRSQLLCMAISAFVESFFFKSGVYETTIFMILKKGIVSKMSYTVEENSSFITVICCVILNCHGWNRSLCIGSHICLVLFPGRYTSLDIIVVNILFIFSVEHS